MKHINHSNQVTILVDELNGHKGLKGAKGEIKKIETPGMYLTENLTPYKLFDVRKNHKEIPISDMKMLEKVYESKNRFKIKSGPYKGTIGQLMMKNTNTKYHILIYGSGKMFKLTKDMFIYQDILYNSGVMEVESIDNNNIVHGKFLDASHRLYDKHLDLNDENIVKNIKTYYTIDYEQEYINDIPHQDLPDDEDKDNFEENYPEDKENKITDESEDTGMVEYVSGLKSALQSERAKDEFNANDELLYAKIVSILNNLKLNKSIINIKKVKNQYNSIMELGMIESDIINELDNSIILLHLIMLNLSKVMDISELYKENKGNKSMIKYYNMIKTKNLINSINATNIKLSNFTVKKLSPSPDDDNKCENKLCTFFKTNELTLVNTTDKLYNICFNIFTFIKNSIPEFRNFEFYSHVTSRIIPVSSSYKYQQPIPTYVKATDDQNISRIEEQLKIAEVNNNIEQIEILKEKLEELQKKKEQRTVATVISVYKNLEDYYTAFIQELNNKLSQAIKNNDTVKKDRYNNIINNLLDLSKQDALTLEYRNVFKEYYKTNIYHKNLLNENEKKQREYKNIPNKYEKWFKQHFKNDTKHLDEDRFNRHFDLYLNKLQKIKEVSDTRKKYPRQNPQKERELNISLSKLNI